MGLGGVAIATLPSVICAKLMFSDGLGGGDTSLRASAPVYLFERVLPDSNKFLSNGSLLNDKHLFIDANKKVFCL